ncbi:DNA polymerase beta superfamily protein [Nocardia farcinica]|uniref:DNA polymerase beta superfamily protein n=1 Tax=Nocardia farcinica TaxID=37329 RepID=UPI0024558B63|nr:nucleotidyltransferase domain-containing protein [Nocardia farcinica]
MAARDVIETPITGLLDVNGWDPAKALRLLVRGNAVLVEWLRSRSTRLAPASRPQPSSTSARWHSADDADPHRLRAGLAVP